MACDPGVETPGNDRAPCRAKRKKWPVIQALKRLATIVRPPGEEKEMACDPGVETPGNDRAPCRAKRRRL
jgi:hypothetical protein